MQATDLLRSHPQDQYSSRIFRPHLDGHHALVRSHGNGGQYPRSGPCCHPTTRLSLLNATNQPWQSRHGSHKQNHHQQRLRHASRITHG